MSNKNLIKKANEKSRKREQLLSKELMKLTFFDFLGFALILKANIYTEDNKISNDFSRIEAEMMEFFRTLPLQKQNKLIRRVRQVQKYNKIEGTI